MQSTPNHNATTSDEKQQGVPNRLEYPECFDSDLRLKCLAGYRHVMFLYGHFETGRKFARLDLEEIFVLIGYYAAEVSNLVAEWEDPELGGVISSSDSSRHQYNVYTLFVLERLFRLRTLKKEAEKSLKASQVDDTITKILLALHGFC